MTKKDWLWFFGAGAVASLMSLGLMLANGLAFGAWVRATVCIWLFVVAVVLITTGGWRHD